MEDMNWSTVLTAVGGSGVLTAGLTFLLRSWISERLKGSIQAEYAQKLETLKSHLQADADMRLEVHKATLKASGDAELEKLRAQLAATASEHDMLHAALTQRRFEAIEAVHKVLHNFHRSLSRLTAVLPLPFPVPGAESEEVMREALVQAYREFDQVFAAQQIFLTDATAKKIEAIRFQLVFRGMQFHRGWGNTALTGNISEAMKELRGELRALMGDKPQP